MKIAYLDCASGISGDMTLGALVDIGVPLDVLQDGIASLGLPSCRLESEAVTRRGFRATKVHVRHEPEHAHRHLHHITDMIDASRLPDADKELAKRIFTRLGEAEAHVHGTTLRKVHFHEVGAVDSIADIVGAAIGWNHLAADRIVCSPVPTGGGFIEIAHGRTSVPAPATAELLKGIPLASCDVQAELTTPTGAAIVATIVDEFGGVPAMTIETVGYGAGDKDFATHGNVLRLIVGQSHTASVRESVWLLETNLDDCTGELIAHCAEHLFAAGALDVYTTAIQMKKNRPAVMLSVLCEPATCDALEALIFQETTTLGVRRSRLDRRTLARESVMIETSFGLLAGKRATLPDGSSRTAPEYASLRQAAEAAGVPLRDVYAAFTAAAGPANA